MNRKATEREKLCAKHIHGKRPIFRIYKELIQLNGQKIPTLHKGIYTNGQKHIEKCSSLIIRELQITTTVRYQYASNS